MQLIEQLLTDLPDGDVVQVGIGLHWTVASVEVRGVTRCGLASTLHGSQMHRSQPDVPLAGQLNTLSGRDLAALALQDEPVLCSIGVAALNALLPWQPDTWQEVNAEAVIAAHGQGKTVAIVGHFPFISRLKQTVGELFVIEKEPRPGDIPVEMAPQILARADVVAITGMTVINHTLEDMLKLCSPQAIVMVLGPSTPLSPLLFKYGIDLISGAVVTEIEPVMRVAMQGGNFRQIHHAGVRLVTINRPGSGEK